MVVASIRVCSKGCRCTAISTAKPCTMGRARQHRQCTVAWESGRWRCRCPRRASRLLGRCCLMRVPDVRVVDLGEMLTAGLPRATLPARERMAMGSRHMPNRQVVIHSMGRRRSISSSSSSSNTDHHSSTSTRSSTRSSIRISSRKVMLSRAMAASASSTSSVASRHIPVPDSRVSMWGSRPIRRAQRTATTRSSKATLLSSRT
mmetsp:Transcript_60880/g.158204  ORF Transcript_60880/g.158204 Transcript_60880/m.158204 type:complete len:204 (-) Transcript_60880:258-869(-)